MSLPMPADEHGMAARECPAANCAPGYFKIVFGTGIGEPGYDRCYCPYCRWDGDQGNFLTRRQRKYAESVVMREAQGGIQNMMKDALGLDSRGRRRMSGDFLSIELSMKSSSPRPVVKPIEEELRRDVTCPHCTLVHAVFGLAVWCPDCGKDIFLTHVGAELDVVRKVLGEVEGRRERLGARVAARDIENALEDTVSIFEAVMKFTYRRKLTESVGATEAESRLARHRNAFQNPRRAAEIVNAELGEDLFASTGAEGQETVCNTFQKRHPITHNLGVVDRQFLGHGIVADSLGREVPLTVEEVMNTVALIEQIFVDIYTSLFSNVPAPT
jgi:hypothetical protein